MGKTKPPSGGPGTEGFQYQKGWPSSKNREEALQETPPLAIAHQESEGWEVLEDPPFRIEIVETPAHVEAGEYLVCVEGVRKRPEVD